MIDRVCAAIAALALLPTVAGAWPASVNAAPTSPAVIDVGSNCEDLSAEPITYDMIYDIPGASGLPGTPIDIHDIWLAGGCVGCHNNTQMGGLRLDLPDLGGLFLVGQLSYRDDVILRVNPRDPESSLLNAMLNCTPPDTFPMMPPAGDGKPVRINRAWRAMVYDWIAQGARGFDGDGNPISGTVFVDQFEGARAQRNLASPPK